MVGYKSTGFSLQSTILVEYFEFMYLVLHNYGKKNTFHKTIEVSCVLCYIKYF